MVNVLCTKWGTKYGPEYANTLYSMVRRHLHRPFRFVCLTDDKTALRPEIEARPLPLTGMADMDRRLPWTRDHGWLKLTTFAKPLHDLRGPTLVIDLDVVIVDSLDCFFEHPGEFVVIKEWDKRDETGNTSVYRFEAGAHGDALAHFCQHHERVRTEVRNEQEFITGYLARQGKLGYWPAPWCVSFKRHCVRGLLSGWFLPPRIPPGARVIAFHGKPNPPDAIRGVSGKWYRRVLPTPWVAEHWR